MPESEYDDNMEKNLCAEDYVKLTERIGLSDSIHTFGNLVSLKLPICSELLDSSIEILEIKGRSFNALMRLNIKTIRELVIVLKEESNLSNLKGIGKECMLDIQIALLEKTYNKLHEQEKIEFWQSIIDNNSSDKLFQYIIF